MMHTMMMMNTHTQHPSRTIEGKNAAEQIVHFASKCATEFQPPTSFAHCFQVAAHLVLERLKTANFSLCCGLINQLLRARGPESLLTVVGSLKGW